MIMEDSKPQKLYFILPIFNEEENIQEQLSTIHDFAKNNNHNYKILVVDDGSKDQSKKIVESLMSNIHVEIIEHEFNKGPGIAFKTAFFYLKPYLNPEDIVVTMDADNTQDINSIKKMIEKINQGYDVIVGSIFVYGGRAIGVSRWRYFLSYFCNKLYSSFVPIRNITAYTGFLRVHKGGAIKKALEIYGENIITTPGFAGMSEFLLKLGNLGLSMKEEPMIIQYDRKRGKSKLKFLFTAIEHLKVMIKNSKNNFLVRV